jgi:hypothetical protein
VTGKFKSTQRVRKLVAGITVWQETSSPGREVACVPNQITFARPLAQYAVRTPSTEKAGGYYYAVLFTSLLQRTMQAVVTAYDGRAGMEADLKSDKHGLALAVLRKRRLGAQTIVVLLVELAHNVLVWARLGPASPAPRPARYGIVRLVQEVWAVPGRVKLGEKQMQRVRLRRLHPLAREVARGWQPLLAGKPPGLGWS